jgi:hypothetical protein
MRNLIAIAAMLLCASAASAAPVDSSASGVYLGIDRVCRIVLSRYEGDWVQSDIRCLHFDGGQSASLTTVYAPGTCPQGIAYSLTPWAPGEYLSLRGYDSVEKTIQIVRGTDQTAVTNGIGIGETWYMIGYAPSMSPYSCGSPPQRIDSNAMARYCREHPTVPACRG